MINTGIERRVDKLGRFVLPVELRRNFASNAAFISVKDDQLELTTAPDSQTRIVRKFDSLGRFVLPVIIRQTLEISPGDLLSVYIDDHTVCLSKKKLTFNSNKCIHCNSTLDLMDFHNSKICARCAHEIAKGISA